MRATDGEAATNEPRRPGHLARPPHAAGRRPRARAAAAALLSLAAIALLALGARAEWLQPDPSYKEAQLQLRLALRDTVGQPETAARLDTLGLALMRLNRSAEAVPLFRRVLEINPGDNAAEGALGKLALNAGRLAEAESLLLAAGTTDPAVTADLFAARIQRNDWKAAAGMVEAVSQPGRLPMLERLAEGGTLQVGDGPESAEVFFARIQPTPLLKVKLNGQSVLMALDTGASDLILDKSAARRLGIPPNLGQWSTFWLGSRHAVRGAMIPRLELGAFKLTQVPAAVLDLHKYSLNVNPQYEAVAGVIGMNVLRRFCPTLDYDNGRLLLYRTGSAAARNALAGGGDGPVVRVPFEVWGENELMVFGTLAGGRRMAFILQSGFPGCGVAAPSEVLDEIGVKPGGVAKAMRTMGSMLQGRRWDECTVPSVTVGPIVQDKVPAWSGAMDSGEMWRQGIRRDAIIGSEFLRGRRVTIDWDQRQLLVADK